MKQKQLVHKLNSQKGITGADVVIALLIILTSLGVIAMLYVNLVIGSREVSRKTGATRIATNLIENISQFFYDEIEDTLQINGNTNKIDNTYHILTDEIFNTTIPQGYQVEMELQNSGELDIMKKITVTVKFKVDGKEKKVSLAKVFERETIRECNSPNFTEKYISQLPSVGNNYEIYSENAKHAAGVKIVCPVRYNPETQNYQIVTNPDELWYSYSNKQWARMIVLEPDEVEQTISSERLKQTNSYVWIPRYGIENGKNLFGGTHFKYKATEYAILNTYAQKDTQFIYNHIQGDFSWSINRGITEADLLGKWCPYSDLTNPSSIAYTLNQSQFGPMLEY